MSAVHGVCRRRRRLPLLQRRIIRADEMEVDLRVAGQEPRHHRRHVPEVAQVARAARPAHHHPPVPAGRPGSSSEILVDAVRQHRHVPVVLALPRPPGAPWTRSPGRRCRSGTRRYPGTPAAGATGCPRGRRRTRHRRCRTPGGSCPATTPTAPGPAARSGAARRTRRSAPRSAPRPAATPSPASAASRCGRPAQLGEGLVAAVIPAAVVTDRQPENLQRDPFPGEVRAAGPSPVRRPALHVLQTWARSGIRETQQESKHWHRSANT